MTSKMMTKVESDVLTRRQCGENAFEHLIFNILEDKMDEPIALSFMEYNSTNKVDIRDMLTMSEDDIDDFTYNVSTKLPSETKKEKQDESLDSEENEVTKPPPKTSTFVTYNLPKGSKQLIKVIRTYNNYRNDHEDPINYDWSNVTPDDFNEFKMRDIKSTKYHPLLNE